MKKIYSLHSIFSLIVACLVFLVNTSTAQGLLFIENKGQWEGDFIYATQSNSADLFLLRNGYTVKLNDPENGEIIHRLKHHPQEESETLRYHAYKVTWLGSQPQPKVTNRNPQPQYHNYYLGANPDRWKTKIHPVKEVSYQGVYNGVDVLVHSEGNDVKYDYIVQPGASLDQIRLSYEGVDDLSIKEKKLLIKTSVGLIVEQEPYAYQEIDGQRVIVPIEYVLQDGIVSFLLPNGYNKQAALVIDPIIVFATLSGSTADNWGFTATYDAAGNFYAGGIVGGMGYPTTMGAFDVSYNGGSTSSSPGDISITKFNASGSSLVYSTYIGGSGVEHPHSLIVDNANNLILAGKTSSSNYPRTNTAFDTTQNGGFDIIITKFNADGSALLGSTFVGGFGDDGVNIDAGFSASLSNLKYNYGDNSRSEVLVDKLNNIWLASSTRSTNFPITAATAAKTTLGGLQDGVLLKFNPTLSTMLYGSYIGGDDNDAAYVLIFDTSQTHVFVGGGTSSNNFMPASTSTGFTPTYQGGIADGYISKFQTNAPFNLIRSTFIGTSGYEQVFGLQIDAYNNVYSLGQTSGALPITPASVYNNPNGKIFIRSFNNDLTTVNFSTLVGGSSLSQVNLVPVAFLVDTCNQIYFSGWGGTINGGSTPLMSGFPITSDAIQSTTDGNDFYFMALRSNATGLLYGSYFGSGSKMEHVDGGTSRFDPNGVIYQSICATCGGGTSFPSTPGSWSMVNGSSNCNLGALKIAFNLGNVSAVAQAAPNTKGCVPFTVTFENTSLNASSYIWDFGDGSPTSSSATPTHTFTAVGTYTVRLIANNTGSCKNTDTTYLTIIVNNDSIFADMGYQVLDTCTTFTVKFTNSSTSYNPNPFTTATYRWIFGDGSPDYFGVTPPNHNYPSPGTYTAMLIMTDTNACNSPDTVLVDIVIRDGNIVADFDATDTCVDNNLVEFVNNSTNGVSYYWDFGDGNTSTSMSPSHSYAVGGTYTIRLIVTNANSCNKRDTAIKTISIYPVPKADFYSLPVVTEVNKPINFVNTSTGASSYLWDFGDGNTSTEVSPSHLYGLTGNYTVCLTATNAFNCIDSVCKVVYTEIRPLIDIPTGFSPNGDGSNDILFVRGFAVKEMNVKVFNRWGELVFESNDMKQGWNGYYKGQPQPMDAYAYILNAVFNDGTKATKKGNVTLLR